MAPPPVNLITIAIAAGIGLGTALYYLITYISEENRQRNLLTLPSNDANPLSYSPPPQQRSQSSRSQVRSPVLTPQEVLPSTSNSRPRRRETRYVRNCYICTNPLGTDTIGLGCGHTFDKECYNIIEKMWKNSGVSSKCPQCITEFH